jgi:Mg2+ and Co2+ transporter CorA
MIYNLLPVYIFLCRNELEEFCQGLQHYKMLELIRAHMLSFRYIFVHGESIPDPVCVNYIIDTFLPQFSDVGSNRREKEEDIYELWVSFVRGTSG